jgi:hypothetical protein
MVNIIKNIKRCNLSDEYHRIWELLIPIKSSCRQQDKIKKIGMSHKYRALRTMSNTSCSWKWSVMQIIFISQTHINNLPIGAEFWLIVTLIFTNLCFSCMKQSCLSSYYLLIFLSKSNYSMTSDYYSEEEGEGLFLEACFFRCVFNVWLDIITGSTSGFHNIKGLFIFHTLEF